MKSADSEVTSVTGGDAGGAETVARATLRPQGIAPTSAAPLTGLSIRVARGSEIGGVCRLGSAPISVGSAPTSGLCIVDRHVSRTHCELFMRGGQCVVRDLDSTNGTYVDGARIVEAVVSLESRIRIGNTELRLDAPSALRQECASPTVVFGEMVGSSKAAKRLFAALRSVAASPLGCLLLGETGTGKELAARALHEHSARAAKPFLVVDCASVGTQFIEDKLFGHERGAFTGATSTVRGVFEEASGGSVFLDEIGELSLSLQAKLLGVLERREATRIGSHKPIKLDVRLIAATHRDPAAMAKSGHFRQDLLYRISEFTVRIPPLRERKDDIGAIALAMLNREGYARSLSADAIEYLEGLDWPGNVRELRNVMRRAATLATGVVIDRQLLQSLEEVTAEIQLPDGFAAMLSPPQGASIEPRDFGDSAPRALDLSLSDALEAFRKAYFRELRRRFGDDINAAAAHAGVHPKSMSRLYRLYRIS